MLIDILQKLFKRDLTKLKNEIAAYQDEENIWIVDKNITNCGGNLCLHLVGNLNHFIGTLLGETGYVRQRALEFSLKNVPSATLLQQVEDTMEMIEKALNQLTEADLAKDYPIIVFKKRMTTGFFLTHLTTHLTYHLGQINYHRRLLDEVAS
ncbi:MAG: DinB family protein [Saprospiraceae bacterium]